MAILGRKRKAHPITTEIQADGVRPVPYGAVGKLCFFGPQLVEVYFKKPDITSAAFIDSRVLKGQHLYPSSNLARYHLIEILSVSSARTTRSKLPGIELNWDRYNKHF